MWSTIPPPTITKLEVRDYHCFLLGRVSAAEVAMNAKLLKALELQPTAKTINFRNLQNCNCQSLGFARSYCKNQGFNSNLSLSLCLLSVFLPLCLSVSLSLCLSVSLSLCLSVSLSLSIYIYIYAGQPDAGPHLTPHWESVRGPLKTKRRFFLQNGAPWVTVRGPQNDGWRTNINGPNETDLWTLNRLACGPRTGFQIGHFRVFFGFPHFAWNPYFYSVFVQIPIQDVKCWAQIGQNFRPSKTNLNKGRAVLWSLNQRSKWDLEIKQNKKKKHQKNVNNTKQNASFCRTEPFPTKKIIKSGFLMALGCWLFCGQRPVMTTTKKTLQNKGFCCFCCCIFCCSLLPHSNNITTKQLTTTATNNNNNNLNNQNKNKQQQNNNHGTPNSSKQKSNNSTKPNEQIHYKTIGSVVGGFVLSLVVVAQPT